MKRYNNLVKLLSIGTVALVMSGCGGGSTGVSDVITSTTPSIPTAPTAPTYSLFNPPSLPIATNDEPYKIDYNIFKIDFTGKTYIEFITTQDGIFRFKSSSYGYNESEFEIYEYGTDNIVPIESGDILEAGRYTMKVYNDKTVSTGVYFTLVSNYFSGVSIAELPYQDGLKTDTDPSFKSYWVFNLPEDKCVSIQGKYQDVYLYNSNLVDTELDIDNNIECISKGTYYIYYSNHTVYTQPFELVIE